MANYNHVNEKKSEAENYIQKLRITNVLREPVIRSAIQALNLPSGSTGLDAGCGLGFQTVLLAEATGPDGHITGLDLSSEFLKYAENNARETEVSNQISFKQGNINTLPFNKNTFDWILSIDCAGYQPTEKPVTLIKEFARVVKPGGTVTILFWSSQQILPGFPLLEARLNTTSQGIAPYKKNMRPESHIFRALGWFRKAGLKNFSAHTFVSNICAPLDENTQKALHSLLLMRWEKVDKEVSTEDWTLFQQLCNPDSSDYILNCPDYYAFFTYSMFSGKVVG